MADEYGSWCEPRLILDEQYVIRGRLSSTRVSVELEAVHVTGQCVGPAPDERPGLVGKSGRVEYTKRDGNHNLDMTPNLDEAQRTIEASIKWDGCAEVRYHPDEPEAQSHFCHREDAVAIGALLGALYDLAEEILPEPDFGKAPTDG